MIITVKKKDPMIIKNPVIIMIIKKTCFDYHVYHDYHDYHDYLGEKISEEIHTRIMRCDMRDVSDMIIMCDMHDMCGMCVTCDMCDMCDMCDTGDMRDMCDMQDTHDMRIRHDMRATCDKVCEVNNGIHLEGLQNDV